MRWARKWLPITGAYVLIVATTWAGFWSVNQSRVDSRRRLEQTIEQNAQGVCDGLEGLVNSLIALRNVPGQTTEGIAARQRDIESLGADLEQRVGSLDCHFHLIPAK